MRREEGGTCLLCLLYVHVFMGAMERNGAANDSCVIRSREKYVVCLNLELQQTECALTHNANDLYITEDRRHILIVRGLMSSYRTPLHTHSAQTM